MSYKDPLVALAFNQKVGWKRQLGEPDIYGQKQYSIEADIDCRVSRKFRRIISGKGEEVTSGAEIQTFEPVENGDLIVLDGRDWPVIAVTVPATLFGEDHRRKVYV